MREELLRDIQKTWAELMLTADTILRSPSDSPPLEALRFLRPLACLWVVEGNLLSRPWSCSFYVPFSSEGDSGLVRRIVWNKRIDQDRVHDTKNWESKNKPSGRLSVEVEDIPITGVEARAVLERLKSSAPRSWDSQSGRKRIGLDDRPSYGVDVYEDEPPFNIKESVCSRELVGFFLWLRSGLPPSVAAYIQGDGLRPLGE